MLVLRNSYLSSLQFGLFLYSLTYVVSWFSGLGLIVLFILAVFVLPKTYELYKEVRNFQEIKREILFLKFKPIDVYVKLAKEQLEQLSNL